MWDPSTNVMDSDPTKPWHGQPASFYILYIQLFNLELVLGGLAVVLVWLTVMLSPTIQRSATWVNMLVSWIIYALSFLLLAFAGQQSGSQPSRTVCTIQAATIYAAAPFCAATILALNMEMFCKTLSLSSSSNRWVSRILIIVPYVIWVGILFEGLALAVTHGYVVRQTWSPYCIFTAEVPGKISVLLTLILMAIGILVQVVTIYRFWHVTSRLDKGSRQWKSALNLIVRMAVFNVAPVAGIVVCIAILQYDDTPAPRLVLGALPAIVFCTFGTKKDIFDAWRNCSRHRKGTWGNDSENSYVRSSYVRSRASASVASSGLGLVRPASEASTHFMPKHASHSSATHLVADMPEHMPESPYPLLKKTAASSPRSSTSD